jgi:hypothetical protein
MSRPLDKDGDEAKAPDDDNRPGRVEFDSRGNSVWRWARDVLESTSIMLKRLENKDLALEPTQKLRVAGKPSKADAGLGSAPQKGGRARELDIEDAPKAKGGGFDPYNSR